MPDVQAAMQYLYSVWAAWHARQPDEAAKWMEQRQAFQQQVRAND
jgi:hypothetical protein